MCLQAKRMTALHLMLRHPDAVGEPAQERKSLRPFGRTKRLLGGFLSQNGVRR